MKNTSFTVQVCRGLRGPRVWPAACALPFVLAACSAAGDPSAQESSGYQREALIGEPFALAELSDHAPGFGNSELPLAASNATGSLMTWCVDSKFDAEAGVVGSRLALDGTAIDTPSLPIVRNCSGGRDRPTIAAMEDSFLVVADSATGSGLDSVVVHADGTIDLPVPVVTSNNNRLAALTRVDDRYLLIWSAPGPNQYHELYGEYLGVDGAVMAPEFRITDTDTGFGDYPAVASDGTNSLIVFTTPDGFGKDEIRGVRVDGSGTVLDAQPLVLIGGGEGYRAAIAWNGDSYVIAYHEQDGADYSVQAAKIELDGTVSKHQLLASSAGVLPTPVLGVRDATVLVTWADGATGWDRTSGARDATIRALRLDSSLTQVDANPFDISPSLGDEPVVTPTPNGFLVGWADDRGDTTPRQIRNTIVPYTGAFTPGSDVRVTDALSNQRNPTFSHDSDGYLAVWEELRTESGFELRCRHLAEDGSQTDEPASLVAEQGMPLEPQVVFDGTNHLLVWSHVTEQTPGSDQLQSVIKVARVTSQGSVLDPGGTAISQVRPFHRQAAVDFDGDQFLIVYDTEEATVGQLVDRQGKTSGNSFTIAPRDFAGEVLSDGRPRVAWGGYHLVVGVSSGTANNTMAVRVAADGTRVDDPPLVIDPGIMSHTDVAFGDGVFLVTGAKDADIVARRVTPDGVLLDEVPILVGPGSLYGAQPTVVFDGSNFVVAWVAHSGQLTIAEVSPSGSVLGTETVESGTIPMVGSLSGFTSNCDGNSMAGFHLPESIDDLRWYQSFARLVSSSHYAAGAGCEPSPALEPNGAGGSGGNGSGGASGVAGAAGNAGEAAQPGTESAGDSGGCGCRTAIVATPSRGAMLLLVAAAVLATRRRQRSHK